MAHRHPREDALAYTLEDAAEVLGVSQEWLRVAIKSGDLPAKRMSRAKDGTGTGRILVLRRELEEFAERLPDDPLNRYYI